MFASKILVKPISSVLLFHSYQQKHAFDRPCVNHWYSNVYEALSPKISTYQQFTFVLMDNFYTGFILVILTFIASVENFPRFSTEFSTIIPHHNI